MNNYQHTNPDAPTSDFFHVLPASEWLAQASQRPIPKMLFGELWYEGELSFLFSDTNRGKSVLGVQIAHSLSAGVPIEPFGLGAAPQPVLYFDFELTEKQFESRYSEKSGDFAVNQFKFNNNFLRAEMNPDSFIYESQSEFEAYISRELEQAIARHGAQAAIVDNVTYLSGETRKADFAIPLMKSLKAMKQKLGISILALGHTPKRDLSQPLTQNDLQGSKMLMNFCDSAFAIGGSFLDKDTRYIKQIKERNCPKMYGDDNVAVFEIKKSKNFLGFEFINFSREFDHLRAPTEDDRAVLVERVAELIRQGMSYRDISSELGISLGTVSNYVKAASRQNN